MYEGTITTTLLAMRNKTTQRKNHVERLVTHYNKALEKKTSNAAPNIPKIQKP
jgi:hypothetical protein